MPTYRSLFVCSLLCAFAAACDNGNGGDGGPDGGGAACGDMPSIALGTWVERNVSVPSGGSRTYFVRLPSDYDPGRRYPVVYQLHGCSSNPNREANNVPVENASGNEAIHVRGRAADDCWDNTTDLPYFDALVAEVESNYCVNPERRLLAGYSSGAFFAHRIACTRGDMIRGIATIAGGSPGSSCVGPVAVLQIHDANDQTVMITPVGYPTRDHWVEANGCEDTFESTDHPPCVEYDGCPGDYPVVWCETAGQNHSRQDALAAPIFWDFLSSL